MIMQMIKSFTMYEAKIPANVETYIGYIRMVVDLEMLNPDYIIGLKWPGETLLSLIQGSKSITPQKGNIQSSGMKSGNIFVNLSQYFMIIIIVLAGMLILGIFGFIVKSKREMIKKKLM
jgi:hypothetical protein